MNQRAFLFGVLSVVTALVVSYLGTATLAQSPEASKKVEKEDRRGPLPFYFGKLGLTDTQKEALYSTQEEYEKKLEPLREQLKALVKERDQKMEAALTPGQKLRLQELREEAKKRGEKLEEDPAAN